MFGCELLKWDVIAYILSLSFQIAGAVMLIIKYLGDTEGMILEEYFPESGVIGADENDYVTLEKKKMQLCAVNIYINRASFTYIACGYALSVLGKMDGECKVCIIFAVAAFTVALILATHKACRYIARKKYNQDIRKHLDDLGAVKNLRLIAYYTNKTNTDSKNNN